MWRRSTHCARYVVASKVNNGCEFDSRQRQFLHLTGFFISFIIHGGLYTDPSREMS